MLSWFLLARAVHITVVAFFYFVCWALMVWTDTKGYFRYYSRVRFVLKNDFICLLFCCNSRIALWF